MPPRNNWSVPLYYWTSTDSPLTTNWGTLTSSVADIVEEISNFTQSMDGLSKINEPAPEKMNVSLDEVFEGLSEENKTKINEVK